MSTTRTPSSILIVDSDITTRHAVADYLRQCGYSVLEAVSTDEALLALGEPTLTIDVILCDMAAIGTRSGFELARWVRQNRPELEVKLAGSINSVANAAAELCESGPDLARPYELGAVVDYIKKMRATRDQSQAGRSKLNKISSPIALAPR